MRGKDGGSSAECDSDGITPAYAGKSYLLIYIYVPYQDHPRVCGEKFRDQGGDSAGEGSPPRMRGKDKSWQAPIGCGRITPAYAGKRLKRSHKIVRFINKPIIFHSVCNRLDITNNNPTVLDAAVLW